MTKILKVSAAIAVLLFTCKISKGQIVQKVPLYNLVSDSAILDKLVYTSLYSVKYERLPSSLQQSSKVLSGLYHTKKNYFFQIYLASIEQRTVLDFVNNYNAPFFKRLAKTYAIDTSKWSKKKLNDVVYIQVSKLADNSYIFVVDANNNHSFADDNLYFAKIPADSSEPITSQVSVCHNIALSNIEYYFDSVTYKLSVNAGIRLEIFPPSGPEKDSIAVGFYNESLKEGHFLLNGQPKRVIVNPNWRSDIGFNQFSEITFLSDSDQYIPSKSYVHLKDTAYVDKDKLFITGLSLEGNSLAVIQLPSNDTTIFGSKVGEHAYDFSLPDNRGTTYQPSRDSKGKYVLLDFWGTWCHPCLDNIPDMKKFYASENISSVVDFVGVCVDDLSDKDAIIKKIKDIDIPWKSVLLDRSASYSDNTSIVNLYKIEGYPTYFIIAPNGKIIYRYFGEDMLPQLFKDLSAIKEHQGAN